MGRLKIVFILLFLGLLIFAFYEYSKFDASRIVKKAYGDVNKIHRSEVIWFKLQPYWSVSFERRNGKMRTVMVDPISRGIFGE
ncbi:hypothetical protein D3C85_1441330 [compost metagenome]